jgi:hypothetical protein
MRSFEVRAAWVLGIALPLLEVARRRTNFHPIASYIDDFLGGGLLLWAAMATRRQMSYGRALLCAVWGIICGGLYFSFFGQLELSNRTDVSGISSIYVLVIKGFLFVLCVLALVRSIRHFSSHTGQTGSRR